MQIKYYKASDLIEAEYNPRKLTKEAEKHLIDSLKRFGLVDPVLINVNPERKNIIIGGHQRVKIATKIGIKEIPCVELDLTLEKEKELNIRLNKNTGAFDEDLLQEYFEKEHLIEFGFDASEIEFFNIEEIENEGLTDPDEVPEAPKDPITQPGDLYILGNHRLLCGDSTNPQHVERLMDGKKADMVFTDPPYGMHLDADYSSAKGDPEMNRRKSLGGGNKYKQVIGDHDDFTPELINTVFACFPDCQEVFLWGADYYAELLPSKNDGSWVAWDKRLEESTDKMYGSCFELCWSKSKHKRDIARIKWAGVFGVEQEHDKCRSHPTQKPTALAEWFFDRWGQGKTVIADLYGGSGTTLIACEKTNRHARLMELDPIYCDVIVKRWEDFTGKKAELQKGEE